jgi:hypothetical protein
MTGWARREKEGHQSRILPVHNSFLIQKGTIQKNVKFKK